MRKTKILAYCNSPTATTGFGNASRAIFDLLYATGRYEIEIYGVNYLGDPHDLPYKIWPVGIYAKEDPFGYARTLQLLPTADFDLLFLFMDLGQFEFAPLMLPRLREQPGRRPFRTIAYFPIDHVQPPRAAENVAELDYLVTYAQFARDLTHQALPARDDIQVIPHGIDPAHFFPISPGTAGYEELQAFKQRYFVGRADWTIVTNVNRNQARKDIPRSIQAFKLFREQVPRSILYLHMAPKDIGWDLADVCRHLGLNAGADVVFPKHLNTFSGFPREAVNLIYNCSDMVISTTLGEGFGFSWAEAMATKTPVVMPRHTAMAEFIRDETGYLVDSGTSNSLWTLLYGEPDYPRPLVDVDDMVEKMLRVHRHPAEAAAKAETAHRWVTSELDWNGRIREQWLALFDEAAASLQAG